MAIKSADQITIVDVTDAYSVILTSEAYTFVGGTTGAAAGNSCTTQVVAFCGSTQCTSVNIAEDKIECPTGISASVSDNGNKQPTVTFTITDTLETACEATIPVSIPVSVGDDIVVNKKFSFAVAKTGANGANGEPGKDGANGKDGKDGANGTNGADAISMTITTSAGSVFKNSTGSTVLTAHVFKGSVEQTITDKGVCGSLGTVKWYKGADTTSVAAAKSITVQASDVKNSVVYTAQLE